MSDAQDKATIRILIADRTTPRAEANGLAFIKSGAEVFLVNAEIRRKLTNQLGASDAAEATRALEWPSRFTFVLLHNNDKDSFWWAETSKSWNTTPPILRFTGGNPLGRPKHERWLRALRSQYDPLNPNEVQAILGWVNSGCKEAERPDLLKLDRGHGSPANLAALAIMCQGYLAVHVEPTTGGLFLSPAEVSSADIVSKALNSMGWTSVEMDWLAELSDKRRRVRMKDWWRSIFPVPEDDLEAVFGPQVPNEVRQLAKIFDHEDITTVPAGHVAAAYLALVKMP